MEKEADEGQAEKSLASLDIPGFPPSSCLGTCWKREGNNTESEEEQQTVRVFKQGVFSLFFFLYTLWRNRISQ